MSMKWKLFYVAKVFKDHKEIKYKKGSTLNVKLAQREADSLHEYKLKNIDWRQVSKYFYEKSEIGNPIQIELEIIGFDSGSGWIPG